MIFLLDTDAIIKILNSDPVAIQRLNRHSAVDIGISSIVMYELCFGAFKGRHAKRTLGFIDDLEFEIADFNVEDARMAGEIRASLNAAGTPIGPYDLLIAGQALARDLTVITHKTREFSRVKDLRSEDWEI
ncbi:MAG: type II toxin-antitoxin system VapC family toxin [Acetobacteraceae bacterium]|nr:type II toxin-antitoxin system VapC family toxin [Acetobacteraceae bacterium]